MNTKHKLIFLTLLFSYLVFISCGGDDQSALEEEHNISIDLAELNYENTGGSKTFNITAKTTTSWSIKTAAEWITFSSASGSSNQTITVNANKNTLTEERNATIKISTSTDEATINVIQKAAEKIVTDIPEDSSNMSDYTAVQLATELGVGINIGNTLEAICTETSWGNPKINQELINGIKAAGFKSVRIPIAWSCYFSDPENFSIKDSFFNRVEEVVNLVIEADMFAIINIHWDGGWMNEPTYAKQDEINKRLDIMWKQIATNFRDYDYHLIFAGTNEVMFEGNHNPPSTEYAEVQSSYNQTFINTVRKTGGRNSYRYLAVQTFNTNIDHGVNDFVKPNDTVEKRMLLEVHYYDPYEFTLKTDSDKFWQWGANATDNSATPNYGNENHLKAQLDKLVTSFVSKGIGVFIGEFGAVRRNISGSDNYVADYLSAVTSEALTRGIAPIYWDNGPTDASNSGSFGLFNRSTGEEVHPHLIDALTEN